MYQEFEEWVAGGILLGLWHRIRPHGSGTEVAVPTCAAVVGEMKRWV